MSEAFTHWIITPHARFEMQRRGIEEPTVERLMRAPEQRHSARQGRDVLQSIVMVGGKRLLVRVMVDVERTPVEVVTAYLTSKIEKYWR